MKDGSKEREGKKKELKIWEGKSKIYENIQTKVV